MTDKKKTSEVKKDEAIKEQPVVDNIHEEAVKTGPATRKWGGKFIWGTLFIAVGLILLLSNLGVVTVDVLSLWRLWPILIVATGLSILSLRGWLAKLVYGLAALAIIGLTWAVLTGSFGDISRPTTKTDEVSISRSNGQVKSLDLVVNAGAAQVKVNSHSGDDLINARLKGRETELEQKSSIEGDKQKVELSLVRNWGWWQVGKITELDLSLNKSTLTSLRLDTGASSIEADLSEVLLGNLLIDAGASSVDLKLGDRVDKLQVDIDTGASSVDIRVPKSVGVKVAIDAGLSSRNLPSDYEKVDDQTYKSPGFDEAKKQITVNLDMGVSSFGLFEY